MKISARTIIFNIIGTLVGSSIYALGVNLFMEPNHIVTGGLTGVSILLHQYFPQIGIGVMVLVLNVPLFIISWKMVGRRYMLLSLMGMAMASLIIDLTSGLTPVETEPLMAAMAGGLMMGAGLGLVFRQGGSTGGSDVIARLLRIRYPHMQMGVLILLIDAVVVAASVIVFKSINPGLHSIMAIYLSSRAIDLLLYGTDVSRVAYIISSAHEEEIVAAIGEKLNRGATYLLGEGTYSRAPRRIVLCAIRRQQIPPLKKLVKEIDPSAFIILSVAHEVLGEGFGQLGQEK